MSARKRGGRSPRLLACVAAALALGTLESHAQVLRLRTTGPRDGKVSVIEAVEIKGDLRLRQETFNKKSGGQAARQRQRFRTSEFDVLEATGEIEARIASSRLRVQGTYINNVGVKASMAPRENEGRQIGAILGVKGAGGWELAYFHKWLETDATPADFADSDFGDGGTNRRGHIVWGAYNVFDWMRVEAKYFHTKVISPGLPPGLDDINRLQADACVEF